jgi:hypothetical protein
MPVNRARLKLLKPVSSILYRLHCESQPRFLCAQLAVVRPNFRCDEHGTVSCKRVNRGLISSSFLLELKALDRTLNTLSAKLS